METLELSRDTWAEQLRQFTKTHEGWLVSGEILGLDIGAQPEINDLPLVGVFVDHTNHDGTVSVSVARSKTDHLTHIIRDVTRVYVEKADDGADAGLQIHSTDGT